MQRIAPKKRQVLPIILSIVLLPGCDWSGSKKVSQGTENSELSDSQAATASMPQANTPSGDVLASINNIAVVTKPMLEEEKEKLFKANPQFKAMLSFMPPEQLDRNIAEGLLSQEIISYHIHSTGVDQQEEYKAELDDAIKKIKHMINAKYFTQGFPANVSDADIQKFYDENKNVMQDIIISRGGVRAVGILFSNESDANSFASQINGDLISSARQMNLADKVKDFKMVNEQSFDIEPAVRERILSLTRFPAIDIVKTNDQSVWVVEAISKEEPKYRPLDERMKLGLRQYLEKEKKAEAFEKELDNLKSKYNVVFNESYFGSSQAEDGMEPEMSLEEFETLSDEESLEGNPIL